MFYEINLEQFPLVHIHLKGKIENKEAFQSFIQEWENLYSYNQPFFIKIDTDSFKSNGVSPDYLQYTFMISTFLKRMRKEKPPLLHRTIICVYNHWVVKLMHILFATHSPLAPVYIIHAKHISPFTTSLWCQYIMNQGCITREMKNNVTFVPSKYIKEATNQVYSDPYTSTFYSDHKVNSDEGSDTSVSITKCSPETKPREWYEKEQEEEETFFDENEFDTHKKIDIQKTIQKELSSAYPTKIHFSPSPDEETMFTQRFNSKKT